MIACNRCTRFGQGNLPSERIAIVHTNDGGDGNSSDPNERYLRNLGQPSGGLLSTVLDMSVFMQTLLNNGALPVAEGVRILSEDSAQAMTNCQTDAISSIPDEIKNGWAVS